MMVIPEIALLPDIKGVGSSGGTLVMTSNPTKTASIKMVSKGINVSIVSYMLNVLASCYIHDE